MQCCLTGFQGFHIEGFKAKGFDNGTEHIHEEWDFEVHDSGSEQILHDTAPAQINPLAAAAEDPQITCAVLID
jgi:hypothetical protein